MISATNAASAYLRATGSISDGSAPENRLSSAAREFEKVMTGTDSTAIDAMSGKSDMNALVQALTEAELALDAAVAIRDKVVEAYQEILRMPV
ncbi:flagellar hook-basal body complex protein FliE [Paracoccus aerodenitrificans]|uniref:flagellar hook-basal body complex protein FliE n=1 Tax=Paracoccus aerodenitrificans TaxID=3017781 RepID=UPI0022F13513|nr:flagellar hook-basal body complex protein FliE [Paracoccus aerodenitrificans]WBU63278.1 flagellar hook-basal body complex protein FliE [Paracoccus aerodenitrificans]